MVRVCGTRWRRDRLRGVSVAELVETLPVVRQCLRERDLFGEPRLLTGWLGVTGKTPTLVRRQQGKQGSLEMLQERANPGLEFGAILGTVGDGVGEVADAARLDERIQAHE